MPINSAEVPENGAINAQNMGLNDVETGRQAPPIQDSRYGTKSPILLGPDGRPAGSVSVGGIMEIKSAAQLIEEERAKADEETPNL